MNAPALTADLAAGGRRVRRKRPPRRSWLDITLIVSALLHATALLLAIFLHAIPKLAPPEEPKGFDMVFDHGQAAPKAVPVPGRFVEMPNGERVAQTPSQPSPPVPPQPKIPDEKPAPQMNLLPPEYYLRQQPPPPPVEQSEPIPESTKEAKQQRRRERTAPPHNPFAHPTPWTFASRSSPAIPRGLHNSHSLDLSMGPMIEGGQVREAIPHIASAGADGDYLERLSEYVETHKYYPESAARVGEDGISIIRALIRRDGTVENVQLEQSSGSRTLDVAWLSLFRGQKLPPFPDDMKEQEKEFTLSMDYELLYRR
jgi:protein TonB